jgi:phosphopantothenoylcysteine decarboxylase/phosphopantothenate--cysteine ligase
MSRELAGKTVLITAGPTREYLDPVRYITNASSGMMGFALAKTARALGAKVVVVAGPTRITMPWGVKVENVITAQQMLKKSLSHFRRADIIIAAAAVGDFRIKKVAPKKIKKTGDALTLTFVPNPDIIAELAMRARKRRKRPLLVGFALETNNLRAHARAKLERKGLDMIVANGHGAMGVGRSSITVMPRGARPKKHPPLSKVRAAGEIFKAVLRLLDKND